VNRLRCQPNRIVDSDRSRQHPLGFGLIGHLADSLESFDRNVMNDALLVCLAKCIEQPRFDSARFCSGKNRFRIRAIRRLVISVRDRHQLN